MLDSRPIPRYMMGFPTEVQEVILRTVESQLKEITDGRIITREEAEDVLGVQLDELRHLCKKEKPIFMSYQPKLVNYIVAFKAAQDQQ